MTSEKTGGLPGAPGVAAAQDLLRPAPAARTRKEHFTIGELSREFDVTLRALRFYEDKGLLTPRRRGQTRIYS
ncbi:MAG TPA: MerR family DNA-binding transcriptional regulator, partial [Hyphomicrobiales bacterium]|nr:MerR family DNA-binding transcriptional regulator [Hyphomicrobiales bacterium]